jgi:hypothetical protein
MTLSEAISAVEVAQSAYSAAVTTTTNDQAIVDATQAKLDSQKATVVTDQQSQATQAATFNASLDALIEVATSSKIPTT